VTFTRRVLGLGTWIVGFGISLTTALPVNAQIVIGGGYPPPYRGGYDLSSSVRIDVKPRDAQVFVDGYYAGLVDDFDGAFQSLRAEPGEHEIALFLPGYRLHSEKVYLQPGAKFKLSHRMEKLGPGEPEPQRPSGEPGDRAAAPPPARGGGRGQGPARPAPDRDAPPPRPSAPDSGTERFGTVSIRVQPADADVFIDGAKWQGPSDDDRLLVELAPGPHRVEVRKSGFRIYLTEVNVRSGETTPLNVALAPDRR
jgi:hypothetical protein